MRDMRMARTFAGILMAGLLLGGIGVARLEAQRGGGRSSQDRLGNAAIPPNTAPGIVIQPAPPASSVPPQHPPRQIQTPAPPPVQRPSPATTQSAPQRPPVAPPNSRVATVTTPA